MSVHRSLPCCHWGREEVGDLLPGLWPRPCAGHAAGTRPSNATPCYRRVFWRGGKRRRPGCASRRGRPTRREEGARAPRTTGPARWRVSRAPVMLPGLSPARLATWSSFVTLLPAECGRETTPTGNFPCGAALNLQVATAARVAGRQRITRAGDTTARLRGNQKANSSSAPKSNFGSS
jgi:hypothetical protein